MQRCAPLRWIVPALLAVLLADAAPARVEDHRKIEYPALPEFRIARPEVARLDNGMRLLLLEDHELPLIEVRALIRTGSNYDPADKTGLGEIFAQVLREGGTSTMSGDEIDDFLAARAASIETGMGGDAGSASMDCLKEDFDEVLELFAEILRRPAFAADKLELAKVQANTGIARRNDSVGAIVAREFRRLVYGPHTALGRLVEYATVSAITREDLLAWHKKYYHPNRVLLGVVGDFDSATMKRKLEQVFADWPAGPAFADPEPDYARTLTPGVFFVEKSDVTQANVRLGHLGIRTGDPDYFAAQVLNEILGGSFASRLFSNVRTKKGLAYSVGGGLGSSFTRPGIFQVGLSTKLSSMAEAVDALREEVRGVIDTPPTEQEMTRAKEVILNSFIFHYDSKSKILGQQMTYAYHGLPESFLETYRKRIESVTREDVVRVARRHVRPEETVLLVVGRAEEFDRPLSSFGEVTQLDITIPPPPDTTPRVERTPRSVELGSELFARAARAIRGEARGGVRALQMRYRTAMRVGGHELELAQEVSVRLPDKMRQELDTPGGRQILVINGDRGVISLAGRSQPLPEAQIAEATKQLRRDLLVLTSQDPETGLETAAAGVDESGGVACELLAITQNGFESRLCIDSAGKVLEQSFRGTHPLQGVPGRFEIRYADYRRVDGRWVPHRQTVFFEGQEFQTSILESIRIDPDLDATLFALTDGS